MRRRLCPSGCIINSSNNSNSLTSSAFARDGRKRPACYGISPFYALRAKGGAGPEFAMTFLGFVFFDAERIRKA